jgi:stringent starvation protein B
MSELTSQKPYLLRALFEWCVDNGLTPYISVVVDENTRVPTEYVRNGEIVLNIGPLAANKLKLGNDLIEFAARFSGTARELRVPITAVTAIYARENGVGMSFELDKKGADAATLTSIERSPDEPRAPDIQAPPALRTVSNEEPETPPPAPPPRSGPPSLRRIK